MQAFFPEMCVWIAVEIIFEKTLTYHVEKLYNFSAADKQKFGGSHILSQGTGKLTGAHTGLLLMDSNVWTCCPGFFGTVFHDHIEYSE